MYGRKRRKIIGFCIALFLVFSCAGVSRASAAEKTDAAVQTIDICMRPAAYKRMISDENEPKFSVSVSVDGGSFLRGKIKLRGNASKYVGLAMPTKRVPVQIVFDDASPVEGTINNSCVKLINSLTPFRLLAEYLALDVFAFCGIPTPAHEFVFLRYNDVDFGLYLAVEDVNEEFLAKHFPGAKGSLFKESQKDFSHDYSISNWFGSLYMTVDNGTDRIMSLLDALNSGEGYEEYLDVDEFLRFFACLAVDGAASSFLTEQNNFFLYDTGEKFILLPWDNSDAFGAYPNGDGVDHYRMNQWENIDYPPPVFTLLMEKEENREAYHKYIRELNESFLAPERIDPYFDEIAALVQPYLERDPTILINQPYTVPVEPSPGFGTVNVLLEMLHGFYQNLSEQLSGETDTYFYNPAYYGSAEFPEGVMLSEDVEKILGYYIRQTPGYDPEITDKICGNYFSYCCQLGVSRLAVDPLETAAVTAVFIVVFCALFLLVRRPLKDPRRQKKRHDSENRRC